MVKPPNRPHRLRSATGPVEEENRLLTPVPQGYFLLKSSIRVKADEAIPPPRFGGQWSGHRRIYRRVIGWGGLCPAEDVRQAHRDHRSPADRHECDHGGRRVLCGSAQGGGGSCPGDRPLGGRRDQKPEFG